MSVYLRDIPLQQAKDRFRRALMEAGLWGVLGQETIPLDEDAVGRVLASPVWARTSSPHYHAAAMDGFALRAEATNGAQPTSPVVIILGKTPDSGAPGRAKYVDTGDPLPAWANAVVPIENVESLDQRGVATPDVRHPAAIRIRAGVPPWTHVRPLGEDIVATQLVLPAGYLLRPVDLGAIAAAGHDNVIVARKPRVAILPTGTELVPIGSELKAGHILEYNSLVLAGQIKTMGGQATRMPIIDDNLELISKAVLKAAEDHDLILLNAGSSAGAEDFSAQVIHELGILLVHGVAVRPGHPVIMGMIDRGASPAGVAGHAGTLGPANRLCPIIGVPGYPVSAALTAEIFVEPLLAQWLGRQPAELETATAQLTRKITSPAGDEDYVRVALGSVGDKLLAAPLARGAGVITSLVQADGMLVIPSGTQGIEAGEEVSVGLYRTRSELQRTILCVGSHDMTLDLMAQFMTGYGRRLVSANVGSQGGLVALRRGEAHLAGSHLLDPTTGEYNIAYIRRYMPGIAVLVVALVGREQGLVVQRGNPKGLKTLADLMRPGVEFVNRQRGAGTRVLLDYHLQRLHINPASIQGYNHEEYTHLAVAAAIASARGDCGLVIAAAARALELDFVPLFQERYDLVIPKQHAASALLAPLLDLLQREDFRQTVSRLEGYDVSVMSKVIVDDP